MITRSNKSTSMPVPQFTKENVESILPLSDMQMAFLWVREQQQSDPGVLLAEAALEGPFDHDVFASAWSQVVQRHEMLRASVRHRAGQRSMLVVWKRMEQRIENVDLSELEEEEQTHRLKVVRENSLAKVIPDDPPCSHLSIVKLGQHQHCLLWSFHHLFLDGWSTAIVIRDLLDRYHSILNDSSPQATAKPTVREYFQARENTDDETSREYWRERMDGYRGCSKLAAGHHRDSQRPTERLDLSLDATTSERLNQFIRDHNLTANSFATACWAIIAGNIFQKRDIVFATTVSGRTLPLEGMQNIAGLFTNVVPVRSASIDESKSLQQWLTEFRDKRFDAQPHEHLLLAEIEERCQLDPGRAFCETLLVVETFPLRVGTSDDRKLTLRKYKSGTTSNFPITCYVIPGNQWQIKLEFDEDTLSHETAHEIVAQYKRIVERLLESPQHIQLKDFYESLQLPVMNGINFIDRSVGSKRNFLDMHLENKNNVELELTSIWEEVLGLSPIGLEEGFFDLGGKSLAAVRVLAKVRERLGADYAPTVLIEHATIRQLAQLITGGEKLSTGTMVRFNRLETGDPVVCLHVGGGYSTYYRFLAKELPQHPVVGMQPPGMEGEKPLPTFEELATFFINQLDQSFQSQRYHLVGYCMGAALALEMARQLEAAGRSALSLTIVDSGPKWGHRKKSWADLVEIKNSTWKGSARFAAIKARQLVRPAWSIFRHLRYCCFGTDEQKREFYQRRVTRCCTKAFHIYKLRPVSVPLKLIRSTQYAGLESKNFHLQWRELTTSEFSIEVIEAEHMQILFAPSVTKIANAIITSRDHQTVSP